MAGIVLIAMVPPVCVIGVGWLLFLHIPALIVCDHINRSVVSINRARRSGRLSYDAIMATLQSTHDITQRLTALLNPLLKMLLTLTASLGIHWLIRAVAPRHNTGDSLPHPAVFVTGLSLSLSLSVSLSLSPLLLVPLCLRHAQSPTHCLSLQVWS